ncbi:MAG TPA: SCO6880 family protein [Acidimicrobiales bacterium]|nr:SCO6880 family protein [Acidimicrobiales bacterium]
MGDQPRYRLSARSRGTAVFGLTVVQLGLASAAVLVAVKVLTAGPPTAARVFLAVAVPAAAAVMAFGQWRGRPVYEAVPTAAHFGWRAATGQNRWYCRLPLLSADGTTTGTVALPSCLEGLEILALDRPDWAGRRRTVAPLGLVRDRRTGTLTGVLNVKGAEFQLVDEADQHGCIFAWGSRVLAPFAREFSPVVRLAWHEWSCPAPLSEHLTWLASNVDSDAPAASHYRALLDSQGVAVARHDLRVTITVDPRRMGRGYRRGGGRRDATEVALSVLRSLADRCRDAGLVVADPLGGAELADAVRLGGDPEVVRRRGMSLPLDVRAGLVPVVHAVPLALETAWDHVRVDGALHRSFWVSRWPTLEVGPRWLEPLLLDTAGTRTVTMVMEPVSPRASRRQITRDAVRVQGDIHNRARHDFRVPLELQRAQADLDRREAELNSGFAEYRYLALIDVSARTLEELDELSNAYIDVAAACGLDIRALDGRHDAAWACSLPIGRAPDRDLVGGLVG